MNILFICSRNEWRSRTAETIFSESEEHVVRSAGTASSARVKVSEAMLLWADMVFCMEDKHKEILKERFAIATRDLRIIVLHIEDEYRYMDPELIEELEDTTAPYF
ncbi:MAG: protein tyrosine phosphatase [Flavobacteriales bacterium]|nr:protein tyrosine phosphatase [Flavobacteriales bacterium]